MKRLFPIIALIVIIGLAFFAASNATTDPNAPIIAVTGNDVSRVADEAVEATEDFTEVTGTQVEMFLQRLIQPPTSQLAQVLFVLAGVILLVFGWRIYNFIVILAGAWVGASFASAAIVTNSALLEVAAILIGGFLGAILAIFLYFIAVFIIGMYVGAVLTTALATTFSLTPISPLVLLIGAFIGGFLLVALSAELVIFISALVGAQMLATGLGLNTEWMLLFTLLGIAIQIAATRFYNIDVRRRPRRVWVRR